MSLKNTRHYARSEPDDHRAPNKPRRTPASYPLTVGWLAVALLALVLTACQPGSSTTGAGSNTNTPTPAPIKVPQGYQGLVTITFGSTISYQEASDAVKHAGMQLQIPCPNPGPIVVDATPRPTDQSDTYPESHLLTAIGVPALTRVMLDKLAATAGVLSIEVTPKVLCPLT